MSYTPNNPYMPGDPYSYDLKWIVAKIKEAIELYAPLNEKFDNLQNNFDELQHNFDDLYNFVQNYFASLDLSSEVHAIIDQMINDGYFNRLVFDIISGNSFVEDAVTAWLNEHVDPVGSAVIVDDTLSIQGAAADAKTVGANIGNIINTISNAQIEGYEKIASEIIGAMTANKVYLNPTTQIDLSGWSYGEFEVSPNTTYSITGTASTQVRLFVVVDEYNNVVYNYPSGTSTISVVDYIFTTPANAYRMYVNWRRTDPRISVKETLSLNFKKADNILTKSGDTYTITGHIFSNTFNLNGSSNGAFRFLEVLKNGALFKGAGDDITPINVVPSGYLGANHGFNVIYNINCNNHGLTTADIGSTFLSNSNEWILIKIDNENRFTVSVTSASWYGLVRANSVPAQFTFNNKTVNSQGSTLTQLYPSIKNIDVKIVSQKDNKVVISESYDIIAPKSGVDYIKAHVGSCDNDSLVNYSDVAINISNVYIFDDNGGCKIYQTITPLISNINLDFYGGVQSQAFGANDYFAVPCTSYSGLTAPSASNVDFLKSTWDDADIPPALYLQFDSSNPNKGYALLIDMADREIAQSAGFVYGSSKKMYPYAIEPKRIIDNAYSITSYRIPLVRSSNLMVGYGIDKMIIYAFGANDNAIINLPDSMIGRKITGIDTDLSITGAAANVTVKNSNTGYAIITFE